MSKFARRMGRSLRCCDPNATQPAFRVESNSKTAASQRLTGSRPRASEKLVQAQVEVASLELLSAVNLRDVRTLDDVADELGVDPAEAAEDLAAAELDGFVVWEVDESRNVPPDFDRRFVLLTQAGHVELYRLQDAVDSE